MAEQQQPPQQQQGENDENVVAENKWIVLGSCARVLCARRAAVREREAEAKAETERKRKTRRPLRRVVGVAETRALVALACV